MHRERNTAIVPEALTGSTAQLRGQLTPRCAHVPPRRTTSARRKEGHETTSSPPPRLASTGTARNGRSTRSDALRRTRVPLRRGLLRRFLPAAAELRQRATGGRAARDQSDQRARELTDGRAADGKPRRL